MGRAETGRQTDFKTDGQDPFGDVEISHDYGENDGTCKKQMT